MEYSEKDMLDLNEENVKKVFTYCLATPATSKENIKICHFLTAESGAKIPAIKFDRAKMDEMKYSINYMLGQIEKVHKRNVTNMELKDGFSRYTGRDWTNNKTALFCLYYLGVGTNQLPVFAGKEMISEISTQKTLQPTYVLEEHKLRVKFKSFDDINEKLAWCNTLSEREQKIVVCLQAEDALGIDFAIENRYYHRVAY